MAYLVQNDLIQIHLNQIHLNQKYVITITGVIRMSEAYDSIMRGLQEAINDAVGNKKLPRRTVTVIPDKNYSADEVKKIRKSTGMS